MPISSEPWRGTTRALNPCRTFRPRPSLKTHSLGYLPPSNWKGYQAALMLLCTPFFYRMHLLCLSIVIKLEYQESCVLTSKGLTPTISTSVGYQFGSFLFLVMLLSNIVLYVAVVIVVVLVGVQEHRGRDEHQRKLTQQLHHLDFFWLTSGQNCEIIYNPVTCDCYATLTLIDSNLKQTLYCSHCSHTPLKTHIPICGYKRSTQSLRVLSFIIQFSTMIVMAMLLLLAGDVERNPGPLTGPGPSKRVTEKDVSLIVEILANYASNWHSIGLQLQFTVAELDTISTDHGEKSISCLKAMLNEWVLWTPETSHGKYSMLEDLVSALRSDTVKLGSVADELLLKFQQVFEKSTQSKSPSPPPSKRRRTNSDAPDHCTSAIKRYATYLKGVYKSALVSSDKKFPNLTCSKFINLALVKREEISRSQADEFTKATLHGHIDEILKKKEPIKLEEVLNPTEGQPDMKCVFLEGPPGVGKSTCVGELCRRWGENNTLKKYSLFILVRLREKRVQEAQNVEDLCYHRNKDLRQTLASEIEACEGKGVLFVLDGFDELPASLQRESVFVELIQGTYLSHCTVLVTSRPSATAELLFVAQPHIHKQIEVVGFTQENIEEYARHIFASQPDILADFFKYTSTNPAIRSLMYIPLNTAIVVKIYRHSFAANRPIPRTMTQLYVEISRTLLKRHLGEDDPLAKQLPQRLEDLPPQLCQLFKALAKFAFEGMERKEVIFDNIPDDFVHFGFMNSPTDLYIGEKVLLSCSFLHLTLQEFLAAFHISQLSPSDQKSVFEKYCGERWDVVWRFVAGLTGFSEIGWELVQRSKRIVYEDKEYMSLFFQCLYEAQEKVDCSSVLVDAEVNFDGLFLNTAFDCYALGYCVANTKCMWKLNFREKERIGDAIVEMFVHGLCSSKTRGPHPNVEHANILSLSFEMHNLTTTSFNQLAAIIPHMTHLREFAIYNRESEGGLFKLIHALPTLTSLQTLRMCTTGGDIKALSHLISPSSSLKELSIGMSKDILYDSTEPRVHSKDVFLTELMFSTVLSPSSLESVMFWNVDWTDQTHAASLLEKNSNLTHLMMIQTSNTACPSHIAKALGRNSHLKRIVYNTTLFMPINDDVMSCLLTILNFNSSLECLAIDSPSRDNILTTDQLLALDNALRNNHTLKQLEVAKLPPLGNVTLDPRITKSSFYK